VDKKSEVNGFGAKLQRPRNFARVTLFLALAWFAQAGRQRSMRRGTEREAVERLRMWPKGGYGSGAAAGLAQVLGRAWQRSFWRFIITAGYWLRQNARMACIC